MDFYRFCSCGMLAEPTKKCTMPMPINLIEAEALILTQAARSRLVDRKRVSLGGGSDWEEAFAVKANRREECALNGHSNWVDSRAAIARFREKSS
jgi:hypothetical protein